MEEEIIGELTLRSSDARDEVFSAVVKNMDNITEDSDGFSPVKNYVQQNCFEVSGETRVLRGTFKDIYNKANNINAAYEVKIIIVYED